MWAVFGIAAALVALIDPLPYVRDVLRGQTRPYRGTWCIWSVLGLTVFASQWADGAGWSLLMMGVEGATVTAVFGLSIRRGVGRVNRVDLALATVAVLGVVGWFASSRPLVATTGVIVADLAAVLMMVPKTWRDPQSETLSTFVLSSLSGVLGALAVGATQVGLLIYPGYFAVVNAATSALIVLRRRALARATL